MSRWAVIGAIVVAAACGNSTGSYGGNPPPPPPPPAPPPPPPPPGTVSVTNNEFIPTSITINASQTVTWTWAAGAITHNVKFEDGVGNSGDQESGTHTRTFSTPGTYRFRCDLHSTTFTNGMHGQVVVQ